MSTAINDPRPPQTLPPKRSSRFRLIFLLITLALLVAVYLPLRANRANDRLRQSLMTSDVEGVRSALDSGADPDLRLTPGTPRSQPGSLLDFVRLILHRSLRPATNNAKTALMFAASDGDAEMVSALLQHNAKVNLRLDSGYSALLYAASKKPPEVVAALLAKGADVHAHIQDGATPLLFAAQAGLTPNVRLLLAKGEDIHEIDLRSQTALSLATEGRHEETIQVLLSQGADGRDLKGARPSPNVSGVRFAVSSPNGSVININGTTTIVQGGQTFRLTPQTMRAPSMSPLAFAAMYGSPSLLKFLWARADPQVKQQVGWGCLCNAVMSGRVEAVRFLLNRNVPVNPQQNPLPTVRLPGQFRAGYDPNRVYTPLHYAAALQNPDIAALLIAHGANVNAEDMSGTTPLLAAASGAHIANVRLLIEHGANVRAAERMSGQNALMRGVHDAEIARLLLDHGLDVNARDHNGRTALMQCYSLPVATLLVERGADVNARDAQGNTELLTAVRTFQTDYVTLLLKHGANVNSANNQGETPLSVARGMRSTQLVPLLTQAGAKN